MAYLTLADAKLQLPPHLLPIKIQAGEKVVNDALLQKKMDAASSLADAYLKERYSLPLDKVDAFLQTAVLHIVQFLLSDGLIGQESAVQQKYQSAVQTLAGLMQGKISLSVVEKPKPAVQFQSAKAHFKQRPESNFWEAG